MVELAFSNPTLDYGHRHFVRYADDFVVCVDEQDAPKVLKALKGRLERFSLELNTEKTKVISL